MSTTIVSGTETGSSRASLLRSAIDAIDEFGEAGVRVEEVGRRAGVSVATIYHWFDSKQGLIEAAQKMRFDEVWHITMDLEVERFVSLVQPARSVAQAQQRMLEFTGGLRNETNNERRMARLLLFGASLHQPGLHQVVVSNYNSYLTRGRDALAAQLEPAKFRSDLDLRCVAAWLHSQALSRRICEIGIPRINPARSDSFRDQAWTWALWGTALVRAEPRHERDPIDVDAPAGWDSPPAGAAIDHGTQRLIVDRVIDHLDTHGEGSLRLRRITRDLHFSETVIHRYFGGREGLIITAQSERFAASAGVDYASFEDSIRACADPDEFFTLLRIMIRSRLIEAKRPLRLRRLSALSALHRRTELAGRFRDTLDTETIAVAHALEVARMRGWVREDLDTLGYAAWLNAVSLAHGIFELEGIEIDHDAFRSLAIDCAVEMLRRPPTVVKVTSKT
jgi:AcrR family transcriptional regulator